MDLEWDEQKSAWTLENRGFDFHHAALILEGPVLERTDERNTYGEKRIQAIGVAERDILFVVYTDRGELRRIISARRADKKERELWLSFAGL